MFRDDTSAEIAAAPRHPADTGRRCPSSRRRLLDLFTSGSIPPGTRLPPNGSSPRSLEVGRSAVREALAALEILGIVDVRPGSGTYLRGTVSELLPQSLQLGRAPRRAQHRRAARAAFGLEIYVARLAAERLTEAQLASPSARHLDDMRDSMDDLKSFVEGRPRRSTTARRARPRNNGCLLDLLQVVRSLLPRVGRPRRAGRRPTRACHSRSMRPSTVRSPHARATPPPRRWRRTWRPLRPGSRPPARTMPLRAASPRARPDATRTSGHGLRSTDMSPRRVAARASGQASRESRSTTSKGTIVSS